MLISKVPLLVGDSKENTVVAAWWAAVGKHLLLRAMIAQNFDCPSVVSQSLWIRGDTETKMDNGAAVVGGGGRVSHLVIPEPAIDYPSFLCLSAQPVKSAGVTQTNRSVFQSVLSREYLSASIVRRPCLGIEEQPLALFCSSPAGRVRRAAGHLILRTKNSLVRSNLASNGVLLAAERQNFGFGLADWWCFVAGRAF